MRRVYFDVTHLRHNAGKEARSGIRRVDLDYADYIFNRRPNGVGIQYGVAGPSLVRPASRLRDMITQTKARLHESTGSSAGLAAVAAWLEGKPFDRPPSQAPQGHDSLNEARSYLRFLTPPSRLSGAAIARNAVYLNVAQHALAYPFFFRWLKVRHDVRGVYFVHDLLPLDQPEFWPAGYLRGFSRALETLAETGAGFITATDVVGARLAEELARRGRRNVPMATLPIPATLTSRSAPAPDPTLRRHPYFIMVGTIEPRKNHLLILNVWREMASRGGPVPRLIVVGARGWESRQMVALLARCKTIAPFVIEVAGLADQEVQRLTTNARGLLFPSFGEGFGMPVTEALAAGTPVIASDLPVLREAAAGKAIFIDPLDGPGWIEAILGLSDPSSPLARHGRGLAQAYQPVRPEACFARLERFLERL